MHVKTFIRCGLVASGIAAALPAQGLGLGRLSVQSSLGQPLQARIDLTAATREELDTLGARIASPGVYRDNNVQYVAALTRARVTLEQSPNAGAFLRISTAAPVNEPFIDLLVEVSWATGRVTRDYTFLLDPPGTAVAQAQPVEPVPPVRAEPAPAMVARAPRASRGAETPAIMAPRASAPRREGAGGAGAASGSAAAAAGGETYEVKRGDTLSKIAREHKPDAVSVEQMLVALFQMNESAFEGRNMNRLRSGQILTLPTPDQAATTPADEAGKMIRMQASDWRSYRDRVASGAPASEPTDSRQSTSGRIGTAVEDGVPAAALGRDQLKVSREAAKGKGGVEDVTAKDKALRDAQERVAQLEATIRDMQKATTLKSQTMSELQSRAEAPKTATSAAAPPPVSPKTDARIEAPKATPTAPASGGVAKAPTPAPAVAAPTMVPPPPAGSIAPAPAATAPVATPPVATVPPAPKAADASAATPPKTTTPPVKPASSSFFDDLFSSTPMWAIGVGALVLLGGIAALFAARRSKTTKFEDSIISGTDIKTNTVFGSTGGGVVNTGDNSLSSDFSREGLASVDTDEVDPIAEAEVYLAYGRDAQAEEILKDALKKDPQRQEVYLKLLEIHAQHNKPSAFETVASELYSVSGGHGDVWKKAMALGRQLEPSNPMFSESGSGAAFAAASGTPVASDLVDPNATLPLKPIAKAPEPPSKAPLAFSLDDDISILPTSGVEPKKLDDLPRPAKSAAETSREATHAALAGAAASAAAAAGSKALESDRQKAVPPIHDTVSFEPESIPRFDLDFNLDDNKPVVAKGTPKPQSPGPGGMSRQEPALATASGMGTAPQLARPAAAIELDKLDLAFDPKRSTFEDPTPSVLDGQWHDAATKLDLAKAYQEMGDVEGAREILQEVLHEGDDQQKSEAEALLAKLA